jgi:hypothetical protein
MALISNQPRPDEQPETWGASQSSPDAEGYASRVDNAGKFAAGYWLFPTRVYPRFLMTTADD